MRRIIIALLLVASLAACGEKISAKRTLDFTCADLLSSNHPRLVEVPFNRTHWSIGKQLSNEKIIDRYFLYAIITDASKPLQSDYAQSVISHCADNSDDYLHDVMLKVANDDYDQYKGTVHVKTCRDYNDGSVTSSEIIDHADVAIHTDILEKHASEIEDIIRNGCRDADHVSLQWAALWVKSDVEALTYRYGRSPDVGP